MKAFYARIDFSACPLDNQTVAVLGNIGTKGLSNGNGRSVVPAWAVSLKTGLPFCDGCKHYSPLGTAL